jgi:hypothetical protein
MCPMSPRLLRPRASGLVATDPDARTYISAVQIADASSLEPAVQRAIDDFVKGCKADNIWTAIKASCILMGAKTLSGALTPLVGSAPTNNGPFVSGDYNRKTGLIGNGSSKYLAANRNNNADPQDNQSMGVWISAFGAGTNDAVMGSGTGTTTGSSQVLVQKAPTVASDRFVLRSRGGQDVFESVIVTHAAGLHGMSRAASGTFSYLLSGSSGTATRTSNAADTGPINVFARDTASALYATHRLSFYWIGESLTLSSLSSRVSTLVTAIGAAIP